MSAPRRRASDGGGGGATRRLSPAEGERCRAMHAGAACRARAERPPRVVGPLVELRTIDATEGRQRMGPRRAKGAGRVPYRHDFAGGAAPRWYVDLGRARNNLVVAGGNYRVNEEGMIEDMARHRRHHHRNPESMLGFLLMFGLALGVTGILLDVIESLLPRTWSTNKALVATLAMDAVLVAGGAMLYKRSQVWGLALVGAGMTDAIHGAWDALGLRDKVWNIFHGTPAAPAGRTVTGRTQNADGTWEVTLSDGTVNHNVPNASVPALGASAGLYGLPAGGTRRRNAGSTDWNTPDAIRVQQAA